MLIDTLRTLNFRNLEPFTLHPHHRFNIIHGQNGQGKTNLLEAIYLLSAARSFRPQINRDLINFDADHATIEAKILRHSHDRIVKLEVTPKGKKIFVNHSLVSNQSVYFGSVNVVTFGPEDISMVKGGPSYRRDFVDRIVENAQPAYTHELAAYDTTLRQRNAALKEDVVNEQLLDVYTDQLVHLGTQILLRRLDFVLHFQPVLTSVFHSIFDDSLTATLDYYVQSLDKIDEPPVLDLNAYTTPLRNDVGLRDYLQQSFAEALQRTATVERRRGFTVAGPHRDDLITEINGKSVKTFASQGQNRGFVLALKIAEIQYLEERYHFAPILLLDDVSSELDSTRNRYLFNYLGERREGQVFITTTDPRYILLDRSMTKLFRVARGGITAEATAG